MSAPRGRSDTAWMADEMNRLRTALRQIQENAEAWHGDDAAKGRALAVIAEQAQEALQPPHAR